MNWKVRAKNPWFWVGICGVVLTAMGVNPEMLTSWAMVAEQAKALISNPFLLGSVVLAILGIFVDPTTAGVTDSARAMAYHAPNKE